MSQDLMPARGVPPGRILSRELEARNWTQKDLAEIMGRPAQMISEIINGKKQITPETAIELAEAFGTSAEFWTNLETNYQLWFARKGTTHRHAREIARKSAIYSLAPIRELVKRGWIRASKSIEEFEDTVFAFLRISSPDELPELAVNFRAAEAYSPEAGAQVAWVRRVEALAAAQSVGTFEATRLENAIPDILTHAAQAEDVAQVPAMLIGLGVHFVIVPHLPKTYLDGAAFYWDGHPVVALTLRYDRIDAFWFTLMHELAHIVRKHPAVYLDNLDPEVSTRDTKEADANRQARDWLLDPQALDAFVHDTEPFFTKERIVDFAASQGRHPGIVVGRLQHEGLLEYRQLRPLLLKVKAMLKDWIDVANPERVHTG